MSWVIARYSVITKMFSLFKTLTAGNSLGIFIGIIQPPDISFQVPV